MLAADAHTFFSCCSAPVQIHKRKIMKKKKNSPPAPLTRWILKPAVSRSLLTVWGSLFDSLQSGKKKKEKCMCENYNYLFVQTHWRNSDHDHRAAQRMRLIFSRGRRKKHSRLRLREADANVSRMSSQPLPPARTTRR